MSDVPKSSGVLYNDAGVDLSPWMFIKICREMMEVRESRWRRERYGGERGSSWRRGSVLGEERELMEERDRGDRVVEFIGRLRLLKEG